MLVIDMNPVQTTIESMNEHLTISSLVKKGRELELNTGSTATDIVYRVRAIPFKSVVGGGTEDN